MIDASLGEILTTVEKLRWVIANVESCLAPDHRWSVFLCLLRLR